MVSAVKDRQAAQAFGRAMERGLPVKLVHTSVVNQAQEVVVKFDAEFKRRGAAGIEDYAFHPFTLPTFDDRKVSELGVSLSEPGRRALEVHWIKQSPMYAHPMLVMTARHMATLRDNPEEFVEPLVRHNLRELVISVERHILPSLQRWMELGLHLPEGSLDRQLLVEKLVFHHYNSTTPRDLLITPHAFHVDDSLFTINFETTAGLHSLHERCIRPYGEPWQLTMHPGGNLQALSGGLWRSLLHSGSNLHSEDRTSVSIFVDLKDPTRANGITRGRSREVRSAQESAILEFLRDTPPVPAADSDQFNEILHMWDAVLRNVTATRRP